MIKIAVFASGNGSNALNIHKYFLNHPKIHFDRIYCNNPSAGIISASKSHGISCRVFSKEEWQTGVITSELLNSNIDFIILAGFLWLVPGDIILKFQDKIINIHPALLPKYGGKGMFGMKVHESVIANNETKSGITIHLVNEEYDKGKILFQKEVSLGSDDNAQTVATKIHALEYEFFPSVIENYITEYQK